MTVIAEPGNGKLLTNEEKQAREREIIDGPVPVVDPAVRNRLITNDPSIATKLAALPCWQTHNDGSSPCTDERPCGNCVLQRRFLALLDHRKHHGMLVHPSEAGLPAAAGPGILLSTVRPERVEWLWPGRIPRGKVTILDGDPGLGKSVLTMDLAARVTRGLPMPLENREPGQDSEPAAVILLNAEDSLDDTVVPRLMAAGADLDRVLALPTLKDGERERPPCLPEDIPQLRLCIKRMNAALVIIDPLMAYLAGTVKVHHDHDVRRALHPLAMMASETGAAVVVIRHLNKGAGGNPLYRGGGSIGIIGAARSGLIVAKDPDNSDRRVLASTKCNLAKLPPSLTYALDVDSEGRLRVGWMGDSVHTAESLLAVPMDDEDRDATQEAVNVLRAILETGPVPSDDAKKEARRAGVADRTLARAKVILGVKSRKVGFTGKGVWQWSLPSHTP